MLRYAPRFHGKNTKNFLKIFSNIISKKKSPQKIPKKISQIKIQKSKNFYAYTLTPAKNWGV
jgi:hypothetical protein